MAFYRCGGGTDTSEVTAKASDVLSPKKIVDADGNVITGTIPSKAAQTYTPGTTNQTIVAGQYLSGAQTIQGDADLKASNILSGVSIFGVNGGIQKKAAQTYTPITSDQTIPAGMYLNGNQTIKGDTNLKAENIIKGKSIFGVNGAAPKATYPYKCEIHSKLIATSNIIDSLFTDSNGNMYASVGTNLYKYSYGGWSYLASLANVSYSIVNHKQTNKLYGLQNNNNELRLCCSNSSNLTSGQSNIVFSVLLSLGTYLNGKVFVFKNEVYVATRSTTSNTSRLYKYNTSSNSLTLVYTGFIHPGGTAKWYNVVTDNNYIYFLDNTTYPSIGKFDGSAYSVHILYDKLPTNNPAETNLAIDGNGHIHMFGNLGGQTKQNFFTLGNANRKPFERYTYLNNNFEVTGVGDIPVFGEIPHFTFNGDIYIFQYVKNEVSDLNSYFVVNKISEI